MTKCGCEAFIAMCDELMIPAEEGVIRGVLLGGGLLSILAASIYNGWKNMKNMDKKYITTDVKEKPKNIPKIEPKQNPRNCDDYFENLYAKKELDFWDELEGYPKVNKSNPPSKDQLRQANQLIQSLNKFENEINSKIEETNRKLGVKMFVLIDPGKYILTGNSKHIRLEKYFLGYTCYNWPYKWSYDKGFSEEDQKHLNDLNNAYSDIEDHIDYLFCKLKKENPQFKNIEYWQGKNNTDVSPYVEEFRTFWYIGYEISI